GKARNASIPSRSFQNAATAPVVASVSSRRCCASARARLDVSWLTILSTRAAHINSAMLADAAAIRHLASTLSRPQPRLIPGRPDGEVRSELELTRHHRHQHGCLSIGRSDLTASQMGYIGADQQVSTPYRRMPRI